MQNPMEPPMENPTPQPPEGRRPDKQATESYGLPSRPSRRGYFTVIAVIAMLTIAALFARGKWFRIHRAEVTGLVHYTVADVLRQAQITEKSTYFNLNENRVRANIEQDRYLRFISMEKVWPDGVRLEVEERRRVANVLYMGIQYVISQDAMVLETTNNITLDNGCVKVTGLAVRDIRFGAPITCQDSSQLEVMSQLLEELQLQGVLGEMSELNLTSLDSIYLVTMDGYTANIGTVDSLRAKIGTVRAVVSELRRQGETGGMIEATVPGQASYRPIQ